MAETHHSLVIAGPAALAEPADFKITLVAPATEVPVAAEPLSRRRFTPSQIAAIATLHDSFVSYMQPATTAHMYEYSTTTYPETTTTTTTETTTTTIDSLERDSLGSGFMHTRRNYNSNRDVRANLKKGIVPQMANGFRFVVDRLPDEYVRERLPDEPYYEFMETQKIHGRPFALYFSERKVPMADLDHYMRNHDENHVITYVEMFSNKDFADLTATAATNAVSNQEDEDCDKFAGAIDGFGDSMNGLSYGGNVYNVTSAQKSLSKLVQLAHPNPNGDPEIEVQRQEAFKKVWKNLRLDAAEAEAKRVRESQKQQFAPVVFLTEAA